MKQKLLIILFLVARNLSAQSVPQGIPPNTNTADRAISAWYRGGNNPVGTVPVGANIFGTLWNSPIYTRTNSANRMKLNGSLSYTVNGYTGLRDGYLLLGYGTTYSNSIFAGANTGAYSQLHLNGFDGTFIQDGGYRPWMKTGVTFTDNNDLSYMGIRKVGTGTDVTETVLAWSDNAGSAAPGPDDLVFRFTSGGGSAAIGNSISITNLLADTDLDGLHVARFGGNGNFGLGNTFGTNPVGTPVGLYVLPQSLAHYSLSNLRSVWQQFTNRDLASGSGTSETASDGLRIGIIGNTNLNVNGTAAIYNQENRHLLFSTNANTTTMNVLTGNTLERMRITAIGAQTNLPIGGFGVHNPGLLGTNLTRVAISHNPAQPVTRPLSLLHLGYNTGLNSLNPAATDGWRRWMDIGTFTSNGTDNIYVGLKEEDSDRFDAVINWGDNQSAGIGDVGPDHLRFIFTSTTTATFGQGDSISQSVNGLETGRFYPGYDTTFTYMRYDTITQSYDSLDLYGRFGVGDFTASGVNEEPTHKLDVIGNGRFRYLPDSLYLADTLVNKYVMVDSMGVLRWSSASPSFGAICSDTVNGKLQYDTKVDLNNYNLYFTNNDTLNTNQVGIGYECGVTLPGKLSVYQAQDLAIPFGTTAGHFLNSDTTTVINTTYTGVLGITNGEHPANFRTTNRGGAFFASGADVNLGVFGEGMQDSLENWQNIGGLLTGTGGVVAIGSFDTGRGGELRNVGVSGIGTSPSSTINPASSLENIGGQFSGSFSDGTNYGVKTSAFGGTAAYGIYATATGATSNWAGYFDGLIETTQPVAIGSDAQFKTEVNKIENALGIISKLQPKTYKMDTVNFEQFQFSNVNQFGFIAQEVEDVLPELIHNSVHPGVYDSLGVEMIAPLEYKAMNYNAIIPINTQAIKELNAKIDRSTLSDESIKDNVNDLTGSLDKVLEMRGVNYTWSQNGQDSYELDSLVHIGYIAQEMNQIDPLLTFVDSDTLMHVRYDKVVPIITESIQELNTKIEMKDSIIDAQGDLITDLNNRLTQLENCLSGILPFLCQMSNSAIQPTQEEVQNQLRTAINVNLSDRNAIVLNQNVPNPFAESTVITYSIPASVQKAQIHFYDGQGKLINSVDVIERGNGQLNVFANDLSSGVYTYSLVADGQIVSTKRMMKQ